MWRVVGDDRAFQLGVPLFKRLDLVFFHIDRTEDKVDLPGDLFRVGFRIHHDHGFDALRNRIGHMPLFADGFRIGLAGTVCARRKDDRDKPGVICRQQNESLTDHASCTNDTDSEFFHDESSNPQTRRKVPVACHFGM